nr:MAG TPA: hypothetical protein [Caudoviricetes sp.]
MTGAEIQRELNAAIKNSKGIREYDYLYTRLLHRTNVWLFKNKLHRDYSVINDSGRVFIVNRRTQEKINEICPDVLRGGKRGEYVVYNVLILSAEGGRPQALRERKQYVPNRSRTERRR